MSPVAVLGLVCVLAWQGAPPAQPAPKPPTPLEQALARWDAKAKSLRDLTVPFTQERTSALRPRVTKAGGTLQLRREPAAGKRPSRRWLRWHFTAPRERIEVMGPDEVRTYEPYLPKAKQVVEVRDLRAFGIDPDKLDVLGQPVAAIRKSYDIKLTLPPKDVVDPKGTTRLLLLPKDSAIEKRVAAVELVIDDASGLPRQVEIRGPARKPAKPGGRARRSVTTYRFDLAKAKRNAGLKPERFTLAPPGVPVTRR